VSGKEGNNRRGYRRRERESENWQKKNNIQYDKGQARNNIYERLHWKPPVISTEPLPTPDCPYCGKQIKDITMAIADKDTNTPVHFDCVIVQTFKHEILEKGDVIAYIGGGRFGIVHYNNSPNMPPFKIKKILEWEDKENRAEWRKTISDRYSLT